MEGSILTDIILPLSLFIIMLGMGLSLSIEDFRRIFVYPKAVLTGLINQIIFLPIIGFTVAYLFIPQPELAVGLMIIAACPGGVTSNLISHVSNADTALSISLTAISSFITVITIPLILSFSLGYFLGDDRIINFPILKTVLQIIAITILPVSIGMWIKSRFPDFAQRMLKPTKTASTILFILILIGIIAAEREKLIPSFKVVGSAVVLLNILTLLVAWISSYITKLNLKQTLSVVIESGIQNGTLAILVATTILQVPQMALPAAVYSLFMFIPGGIFMWWFGRKSNQI